MNKKDVLLCSRFLVVLTVILHLTHITASSQGSLTDALPKNDEARGWAKHRALQQYKGENLYEYINGGAEIYHEYGFKQVVVQDYINEKGKSISVEIFEMASPASAYGIYTFKTDAKGKRISVGSHAQLADYYMNFWKGSFLVTLTGFDETEETRIGLLQIAKNISSKITVRGDKPHIVSLLLEEDLKDQSLKYFTGYLGLRNSHPFFSLEIVGFEQGIKGDYADGFSFFLFRFGGEGECHKGFELMKGQKDRKGRRFFVTTHREYLMLVLGEIDHHRAKKIFDRVREKIQFQDLPT
jgi:hypothetical protein